MDDNIKETGLLIAAGSLLNAFVVSMFGYFRAKPLVPSSNLEELRGTVKDLRERIKDLEEENRVLSNSNKILERRVVFWQQSYEELQETRKGD